MTKPVFADYGAHVLVDGQFGSTGKGLFAAYLAEKAIREGVAFDTVISNAGPNSGHTFYDKVEGKVVLKQLPTFAVASYLRGRTIPVYLSAGAVIDVEVLRRECDAYPGIPVGIHPNAVVITEADKDAERNGSIAAVAGTRSGTGHAVARKVLRYPSATIKGAFEAGLLLNLPSNAYIRERHFPGVHKQRLFMEVSQGFSLGLNSEFYPKVTSRECTAMQGIADARIAPKWVQRTYMVARTFPIRVGDVDGFSSGAFYDDQEETSWDALGVEAERTTVTNRVRRVFTWSHRQMVESVRANQPDLILLNFMNYLETGTHQDDMKNKLSLVSFESGVDFDRLYGFGPRNDDIVPF